MSPSKILVFLGFVALAHGCAEEFQQCAEGLEGRIMQYMAGATSFSDIEVKCYLVSLDVDMNSYIPKY